MQQTKETLKEQIWKNKLFAVSLERQAHKHQDLKRVFLIMMFKLITLLVMLDPTDKAICLNIKAESRKLCSISYNVN